MQGVGHLILVFTSEGPARGGGGPLWERAEGRSSPTLCPASDVQGHKEEASPRLQAARSPEIHVKVNWI